MKNILIGKDVIINETGEYARIVDDGVFENDYVIDNDSECHIYSLHELTVIK